MPRPYPCEFREDVVRVARNRGPGVTLAQVARDFGVHEMTLSKWISRADVEDGVKPGVTTDQAAELRELRRRDRLLEQENEVLRRAAAYLSQAQLPGKALPARDRAGRCPDPGAGRGRVPGPQAAPPALLRLARERPRATCTHIGITCRSGRRCRTLRPDLSASAGDRRSAGNRPLAAPCACPATPITDDGPPSLVQPGR